MGILYFSHYSLLFKGSSKTDVSFSLSEMNNTVSNTEQKDNIIYIVSDKDKILYVGEAKTDINSRFTRGFYLFRKYAKGVKPKDGYKGYKWIEVFLNKTQQLKIVVAVIEKKSSDERENKLFRESIEGELCFEIRLNNRYWPEKQNEIHFHNNSEAAKIAKIIYGEISGYDR